MMPSARLSRHAPAPRLPLLLALTGCATASRLAPPRRPHRPVAGRGPAPRSDADRRADGQAAQPGRLPAPALGREGGQAPPGDPALGRGADLPGLARRRASAPTPSGWTAASSGDTRLVRFERVGPRVLLVQPTSRFRALGGSAAEREGGRRVVRLVRARGRSRSRRRPAGRLLVDATDFFLRDAHGVAARLRDTPAGQLLAWTRAQRALPAAHEGVPAQHRGRGDPHLRDAATARAPSSVGDADAGRGHRPPAPLVRAAPAARVHAAARWTRARAFFGIEFYDYASPFAGAAREALHRAAPPAEEGPRGGGLRGRAADRLLRRQRRARADPQRARGGRLLVEGGVRARPASATPSRSHPARRRRPAGHPLQRHQLGAPLHARLVLRRAGDRPAHRRDPQGQRLPRARCASARTSTIASGLDPALRGPEPGGPGHPRSLRLARPSWRWRASASSPRTRSATRSASTTTSRPAPTDRASVMDYPAPLVSDPATAASTSPTPTAAGIGAFDVFAIRYAYSQFAPGTDEEAALAEIVREGVRAGMLFVSDEHARDPGHRPSAGRGVGQRRRSRSSRCATRSRCGASPSTASGSPTCARASRSPSWSRCSCRSTSTTATSSRPR